MRSQDRTAKAVIRDEAMRLFAEHGADAVTVREIAAAAAVSPALVIQHYGSKDGLRDAVDRQVLDEFATMIAAVTGAGQADPDRRAGLLESAAAFFPAGSALPRYLGRMLIGGGESAAVLFRRLFELAKDGLDRMVEQGGAVYGADANVRAALLLVNDLAVILLRERITEVIGVDPLSADGIRAWGSEVLDIYGNGLAGGRNV